MKRFNTYNPYARLPKAETGMNVRGNRNQLAQKETTTKNVGTWFEDAGKWLLNTLVSPIELISGTNFYDPEMAHSGWQQFDDVSEGVVKGVGDALGYVYGGPMYGAAKAGISGIADAAGAKDDVARMSVQYGGRLQKAQDSFTTSNTMNFANQGQLDNYNNIMGQFQADPRFMETVYGSQGMPANAAGGQTTMGNTGTPGGVAGTQQPQTLPQQPSNIPTNAGTYGDPTKGQGWSDAVMDAASDPAGATANMIAGFANAGKNPVVAKDTGVYQEITANTDSHPGSLAQSMGDIIAGVDPTEYAYTKKHEDNQMRMKNANKQMRAVGNIGSGGIPSQYGGRLYQMGGTVSNPYMKTHIAQENAKSQGGMENMAGKVGAAIQHAGGVVGESLSGMGMGGGGGGGMGGMLGGGGQGGGGMGGMMDVFGGGGEGGSGGGGFMDAIGGIFGGESGDNFNFKNIMSGIGGMTGGGGEGGGGGFNISSIMNMFKQNGGRVPVRKGKSPYIATHYYQDGTEVKPEDMPRKATAADLKRINEWLNNTKMVDTPYPPTDSTDNPYYNIMNEIDSLSATPQGSNEDFLNQPFQYGGIPKAQDSETFESQLVNLIQGNTYKDNSNNNSSSRATVPEGIMDPYTDEAWTTPGASYPGDPNFVNSNTPGATKWVHKDTGQTPFQHYLSQPSLQGRGRMASDTLITNDPRLFDTEGYTFPDGTKRPPPNYEEDSWKWGQPESRSADQAALAKAFEKTYGNLSSLLTDNPDKFDVNYKKHFIDPKQHERYAPGGQENASTNYRFKAKEKGKLQYGGRMPKAQNGLMDYLASFFKGGESNDLESIVPDYRLQYDSIPYPDARAAQIYNDPFADKEKYPVPEGMQFNKRDSILGRRDRGIELTAEEIEHLGPESDRDFRVGLGRQPWGVDPDKVDRVQRIEAKQNGGRLAKTSNLPMDMEGFTDLDQGFNRSNTIEINSGNNHSDLDNPHTPLNIPVPSFDEQGNAMTENVQILAEKGEFARKDPDTEAVTIFSKNLKTKDSSGKRTNYAKIAEKLGKKEERLTTQAKNPFDDIADASIQRALNNVKNKFIRLEEEQKVAKELKEEEDRMDLMQLAKNGGRITNKNTYRVPGRKTSKVLSEYQKDLLGMDESMPKAQYSLPPEDMYDRIDQLEAEEGNPYKKQRKTKAEIQKERETRRNLRELEKQQIKGEGPLQTIEKERGITKRNQVNPSELAKQIAELPEGKEFGSMNLYTNEGARKANELLKEQARKQKQQEAEEDYEFYSNLSKTGGTPKTQEEEYSTAPEEETGEQQPQQQQQQRGASGDSAINDYINNLRGINSEVEQSLTPYQNYFEDYGRETENIMRNTANDLPRYYEDRAANLNAANVNAAENQVRNMSGMGSSGYLANMQALKNKELRANNDFLAQSQGQEDARLGKLAEMIGQHRQIEATGATVADDRTREAEDALYSARYDTEKNILTGRLAQTNEANTARRNELLDKQMQWMYNNDRTQYDKDGNPVNPDPAIKKGYGGSIKRDMYEYGSRVKREKQMKSDRAMNDFRSFMSDYNKK